MMLKKGMSLKPTKVKIMQFEKENSCVWFEGLEALVEELETRQWLECYQARLSKH